MHPIQDLFAEDQMADGGVRACPLEKPKALAPVLMPNRASPRQEAARDTRLDHRCRRDRDEDGDRLDSKQSVNVETIRYRM